MLPAPDFPWCDNHLLAADKPAGLPSQPDASGDPSLIDMAKEYVRERFHKPGNVYLALLHRLDRPTSGLVLLGRTDKAASRMADAFRRRAVEKRYLAVVQYDTPPPSSAALVQYLTPAANGSMRAAAAKTAESREARLRYRTLAAGAGTALLEVNLETGVKHQIRCQLAHAGMPVAGDFRYGPRGRPARPEPVEGGRAILLHAWQAAFEHPVRKERMELTVPPPAYWRGPLSRLPGCGVETR